MEHSNKRVKSSSGAPIKISSYPSRGTATSSASVARPSNGATSLRLTVKAPPSKLRQATSRSQLESRIPPNPYTGSASESDVTPRAAVKRNARSTRNPRPVVEQDSDEEEIDSADNDIDSADNDPDSADNDIDSADNDPDSADDDPDSADNDPDSADEEDLEGEEDDEDDQEDEPVARPAYRGKEARDKYWINEDAGYQNVDMEDDLQEQHPPPPIIKEVRSAGQAKPNVTVTAPLEGPLKSVEEKEMEDEDEEEDEDDLSDLGSNDNDDNDEDEEDDSDDDDEDNENSRSATPDLSKLTRRQRGVYEEEIDPNLMALSNEAQKKKHLTAEEHAMRRAEMARRRKNLSEKRNEEEKMDTINKLLKKPAPKRRTRAEILAAQHADSTGTPGAEDGEEERPDPLFVRWVNANDGSRAGIPVEWLEGPLGESIGVGSWKGQGRGRMVEEVA